MTGQRRPRNDSDGNDAWENINGQDISEDEDGGDDNENNDDNDSDDYSDIEIPPDPLHIARMAELR